MEKYNFQDRLIGLDSDTSSKLQLLNLSSIDELIKKVIPASIREDKDFGLGEGMSEFAYTNELKSTGKKNKLYNTFIGQGFYGTIMPAPIQRNILENPSWYTSYTPYQAEISQGRLEALLNFQTMVIDLTGMPVANASLLDEASATAEAMLMFYNARSKEAVKRNANKVFIDKNTFKQNIDVVKTKAIPFGIEVIVGDYQKTLITDDYFAVIVQYPNSHGIISDYSSFAQQAKSVQAGFVVVADIMSLVLLTPPGEWGADVVVGSVQRFGLPMGFGGPHAAFFATKEEFLRKAPGRIIGISEDAQGKRALRMALQTREQHIKREKATSNICTAQALLANMAGMYAVYHGKNGLKTIAEELNKLAFAFHKQIDELGYDVVEGKYFDTVFIKSTPDISAKIRTICSEHQVNLFFENDFIGVSFDETKTVADVDLLVRIFAMAIGKQTIGVQLPEKCMIDSSSLRKSDFLTAPVFSACVTEHELMRYIKKLERKDISLTHSMISLGSCTMKLNGATTMIPLSWPEFSNIHPFVHISQSEGYNIVINELGQALCRITGFDAISFQPNSGATGEYAGLLVMREYFHKKGEKDRNIVLIPASAHGTNPASAIMAGLETVTVACDTTGNINIADLKEKAQQYSPNLLGLMVTYPSTHGVFEDEILDVTRIIHENGGLVYMDGANMNAQVGLTNPAKIGADVCHLNLHKTFGIPHGGGGPGVGPVLVRDFLAPYLPSHSYNCEPTKTSIKALASAQFGNANVLLISHAYVKLLGNEGLRSATSKAILNANYIANALSNDFQVLYKGANGYVAHELILDCREFKKTCEIEVIDIAKRLMDFGFHAPTVSFPVPGTLMIEPTESESKEELDRFIQAMKYIRNEIRDIENGKSDKKNNSLKNAPHTQGVVTSDEYNYPYTRKQAAFPLEWIEENKFWPSVSRVNDAFGDRNFVCSCNC